MATGGYALVDDVSRLPFPFFMKDKDDAATYIKEYVEMVNTQQPGGVKVQQMHSDSGGEFINKDLDKFLKGKGVKQTVSTLHTSEHNGVAERMLRSIISIAWCLLIHSRLSQFWCEAVWYACLVYSCTPTKAVDGVSPMERWSGAKPDMSVFHTFGCKCFKMKRGKIKKFAFRIAQCIYLGPAVGGDGYHLYNEAIKHMISSRDVVFHENIFKVGSDTVFVDNSTSTRQMILKMI
jgi:hypothetical protein